MKIHHVAVWVNDLEAVKDFYLRFFEVTVGEKYHNPKKGFTSYFISFKEGAKVELMHSEHLVKNTKGEFLSGLTHFAISVESKARVDELTENIRNAGFAVLGEPRTTGDGYYESVVSDPEGNRIEIVA